MEHSPIPQPPHEAGRGRSRPRLLRAARSLAPACVVALVAGAFGSGTYAAFTATAPNAGNSASSGTVALTDNDAGTALFNEVALTPGANVTKCIRVTSQGSLDAKVRLYAATGGTGLAPYAALRVTRGAQATPSFPSCAGFTADATDYKGRGAGVVYDGMLSDFPSTWAAGLVDPTSAAAEVWTNGESHDYKIEMLVGNNRAAEGKTATASFTWEARDDVSAYATTVQNTSGLLSAWRFGEASGTSAGDSGPGAITGTYTGATLGSPGLITGDSDTAALLNGTTGKVGFGNNYNFAGRAPFTVEMWVEPAPGWTPDSSYPRLISKEDGNNTPRYGWDILAVGDGDSAPGAMCFERWNNTGYNGGCSSTVLSAGVRRHVVGTYDGSTMKIFVDGALEDSSSATMNLTSTTVPLTVGGYPAGGDNFPGTIDDVSLYNRALTDTEVAAHFAAGQ